MNKLTRIALALALLGPMTAAGAEEVPATAQPAPTPLALAFREADAPYEGFWQPFEDGFRLFLPREWTAEALSDAQAAAGLFYRAGAGEAGVAVSYMAAGDLRTPEDLAGNFEAAGFEAVTPLALNGLGAVGFEGPAEDYRGVAFYHPMYPEYVICVYAFPLASQMSRALLASLTPTQGR